MALGWVGDHHVGIADFCDGLDHDQTMFFITPRARPGKPPQEMRIFVACS